MAKEEDQARGRREAIDMKRLIRLALDSPLKEGRQYELDGRTPLASFKQKNTDVKTRMVISIATDAMKGDHKAAEFLMKYGGFEPPKEQNVTVELPTIVDDITAKALLRQEAERLADDDEEDGN